LKGRNLVAFDFYILSTKKFKLKLKYHLPVWIVLFLGNCTFSFAQWNGKSMQAISLQNIDFFKPSAGNWKIEGKANSLFESNLNLNSSPGTGVLINRNTATEKDNIFSKDSYSDIDLQFDFMMPKGSNSGIYFMGRYEIQLFDSWKKENPTFSDCGGVYQRWAPERGSGKEGYEGVAPQSNECKAPGLWQTMKISFLAPRFDAAGKKTSNARFEAVWLNGTRIHTNVEVSGPTRSAAFENELAEGPFMIQGDHGPVAFRNFYIAKVGNPEILWKNLSFQAFQGPYTTIEQFEKQAVFKEGKSQMLSKTDAETEDEFLIHYKGTMLVQTPGEYSFTMNASGKTRLLIDGKVLLDTTKGSFRWQKRDFELMLSLGEHTFDLRYLKYNSKSPAGLAFHYTGPGIKQKNLHSDASMKIQLQGGQLVLNREPERYLQRSFFTHNGIGKPYALNVCNPNRHHFSINTASGKLLRAWRSNTFGDITAMWLDRGLGQSFNPMASTIELTEGALLGFESTADAYPDTLTEADGFRYLGYSDIAGAPFVFHYKTKNGKCDNTISESPNGIFLEFKIWNENPVSTPTWHCLAEGKTIEKQSDGSYLVDGSYYVLVKKEFEPMLTIKNKEKNQRLMAQIPLKEGKGELKYEIVW